MSTLPCLSFPSSTTASGGLALFVLNRCWMVVRFEDGGMTDMVVWWGCWGGDEMRGRRSDMVV